MGALAIILIQGFNTQSNRATHELFRSEFQQSSSERGEIDSTNITVEVGHFHEIFKHRNIAEQSHALYTSLSSAKEHELNAWWKASQKIERNSHREAVQNAILQHLVTINPQAALRYIDDVSIFFSDTLLRTVFSAWAASQLNAAVSASTTLSRQQRNIAVQAILETRDDLSNSELRSIAVQLDSEETYLKLVSDTQASQSIAKPHESWDMLLNDDVDDSLQFESLSRVAEAWREQIGFEVLSHIYKAGGENSVQLVEAIAQVDLASALDYTRTLLNANEKEYLAKTIAREWARTDARTALSAVASFQPVSLSSGLEIIVAKTWATTDPNAAINNIELISEKSRLVMLLTAFSNIASEDPMDAIAKLETVKRYVGNTSTIVQNIVMRWSRQNARAAADWVLNSYAQDDSERRTMLGWVLRDMSRQDVLKAFEIAVEHPAHSEKYGLEHVVLQEIIQDGDIELAKKLLPRVGESAKLNAYSQVGEAMVREARTEEALELGKEIGDNEQQLYYQQVISYWATIDPKDLYASLKDLPTNSFKSRAALQLVMSNKNIPILSDDQIEQARTYLNSEDEATVKRVEN